MLSLPLSKTQPLANMPPCTTKFIPYYYYYFKCGLWPSHDSLPLHQRITENNKQPALLTESWSTETTKAVMSSQENQVSSFLNVTLSHHVWGGDQGLLKRATCHKNNGYSIRIEQNLASSATLCHWRSTTTWNREITRSEGRLQPFLLNMLIDHCKVPLRHISSPPLPPLHNSLWDD